MSVFKDVDCLTYWTLPDGMAATMPSKECEVNDFIAMGVACMSARTHSGCTHVSRCVCTLRMWACMYACMHACVHVCV